MSSSKNSLLKKLSSQPSQRNQLLHDRTKANEQVRNFQMAQALDADMGRWTIESTLPIRERTANVLLPPTFAAF